MKNTKSPFYRQLDTDESGLQFLFTIVGKDHNKFEQLQYRNECGSYIGQGGCIQHFANPAFFFVGNKSVCHHELSSPIAGVELNR